jgi:heat-inducible transcriptional repressor
MITPQAILSDMNDRTREVFRRVVEGYLTSGEPVGSRTLTRSLTERVSAATVRNVMQDLEFLGLLNSPHVSAGRVPTQAGLRMFVDSLLEVGSVAPEDQERIDATMGPSDQDVASLLDDVGAALSVITRGASVVLAPKREAAIKHIEFVALGADRALVVLVFADGQVENRIFAPPPGQTPSSMREAANFLNALAEGRTLSELRQNMVADIAHRRQEIDSLARQMVESGLALWENAGESSERLIVRGRSNLIEGAADHVEIDRIRELFDDLSGSSLVVSPYMNADRKIIGAVGVIGPTRLNYGRIVPIVDYTAQLVGRLVSDRGKG